MKVFTALMMFLLVTNNSQSQIHKGQFLIGGAVSLASEKNQGDNSANYKTTTLLASPNVGYFIIPKLAGGVKFDFSIYKQSEPNRSTYVIFSPSPFLRYYFLPRDQKFNILSEASYIFETVEAKLQGNSSPRARKNGYSIAAGPAIFLNESIALEFLLAYKKTKTRNAGANKNEIFNTAIGLQIHLGKVKKA